MKRIYYDIRRRISNFFFYFRKLFNLPDPVDFKYVDITFENCNGVRIPSRLVDGLCINDIRKDTFTNFCQQYITIEYCTDFRITLKNEALNIKTHFQKEFDSDSESSFRCSFEHHLKVYKDVTHIGVKQNKGKKTYIGVPYKTKDGRGYSGNLLQKNKFGEDTFTISSKEEK